METDFRKRDRQHAFLDADDSDTEMGGNGDSRKCGGKRTAFKGQVKQNHSEIEKRRRDKMNTYINELSSMIPMCNAMSRKLDKLTVLRMAVQHMRALTGCSAPVSETNYKPEFLTDEDLKNLVLESAGGFLVVVGCDRGRILYVSDSVQKVIFQQQSDLVGQSFFDLLHSKDIVTAKDQMAFMEMPQRADKVSEKESVISVKSENKQVCKQMCSGARRSFMCRMKCGAKPKKSKGNDESDADLCIMNRTAKLKSNTATNKKKYVIVHFTGYLKSWPSSSLALDDDDEDQESNNLSCLIAVGREVPVADLNTNFNLKKVPTEFVSRHSIDGKFIYIDQRVTSILGYLPQELLGLSAYDFFHPHDVEEIAEYHKSVLQEDKAETIPYRFICKEGYYMYLVTKSTIFQNPWTKELEFIICVNNVDVSRPHPVIQSNITHKRPILPAQDTQAISGGEGTSGRTGGNEVIESLQEGDQALRIESSERAKIGSSIAEAAQRQSNPLRNKQQVLLGSHTPTATTQVSDRRTSASSSNPGSSSVMETNQSNAAMSSQRSMTSLFPGATASGIPNISQPHLLEQLIGMQQAIESMESPIQQNEETMAMFMNMLEADAGLGGDLNDILFP